MVYDRGVICHCYSAEEFMGGLEDLPILLHHKVDDLVKDAVIDYCGD